MEQEIEKQLIQASQQSDSQAFGQLVNEYQYYIFRLAFRLLCNTEAARDITQEVFIRVWTHLPEFKPEVKFTTWLYKVTANLCYDELRQQQRHPQILSVSNHPGTVNNLLTEENVEHTLINRELIQQITQLTEQLTPKQKLIFTLWDLEGIEPEEIKIITGMSSAKIKSNLYLARKYIRQKLNLKHSDS